MNILIIIITSIVGYLFGSISFARILTRILAPEKSIDNMHVKLKEFEDNVEVIMGSGANKASIILGKKWGGVIGILDMLKVIIPLIIFRYFLFPSEPYFLYIAAFGLIGHDWPIYHRFKGGRGHAVMLGSLIVIDWLAAILNPILGILLGFSVFVNLILASYLWLWMLIPWFLLRTFDPNFIIYAVIVNIVLILGQLPEFKIYFRLRKEGKQNDYKERLLELTAQMRGLKKMEGYFRSLGKWRILIAILTILGTITIFSILPFIKF